MTIRALVVDDEPIARRRLRRMLGEIGGVVVVGDAGSVREARRLLEEERPDVLFVDIEMSGEPGLKLLDVTEPARLPLVVIVSAHSEYAISAFEGAAVDYVLKPVRAERLRAAVERAAELVRSLRAREPGNRVTLRRIVVAVGRRLVPVEAHSIDWIRADENYVWLHVDGKRLLHRATLSGVLSELSPGPFVRVHRSAAVNMHRVAAARQDEKGGIVVELTTGETVPMSRGYRDQLTKLLSGI